MKSDDVLFLHYQSDGDRALLATLCEKYRDYIIGTCYKYLKNIDEAKDGYQDIFIKIARRKIPWSPTVENFYGYLYTIVLNYCYDQLDKRNRRKTTEIGELNDIEDDNCQDELAKMSKRNALLKRCIEKLPEKQRICIELLYFYTNEKGEKLSYSDVSEKTGFSSNAVKSYVQNGSRNLKICVKEINYE